MMRRLIVWPCGGALALAMGVALAGSPTRTDLPQWSADHGLRLPMLDRGKLLAEDAVDKPFGPRRIGVQTELKGIDLSAGEWTRLADGDWQWRLRVEAPGGLAMDFSFSRFHLPEGASLLIANGDGSETIGPFDMADNRAHGEFYTPLLAGEAALLTLRVPAAQRKAVQLQLARVGRAYRGVVDPAGGGDAMQKSGSCNVDIACPQGDAWREQSSSVAQYSFQTGGSTYVCTGQLTADASYSNDRLLTTANHCVSTAAEARSMVLYWGYESPTCRTPGSSASGVSLPRAGNSLASQSGASLLATHVGSDFTVVQLDVAVPPAAQARATGWDRRDTIPTATASIHHPQGHEKRIALDNQSPLLRDGSVGGLGGNRYWHILEWDVGTTEGGSSGSGLWDQQGRLIGVLSGGEAGCGNSVNDFYGRLSAAWDGAGTPATRLRDWLDPNGTGVQYVDAGGGSLDGVSLSSAAFDSPPGPDDVVSFEAAASGGSTPYVYEWDLDGDGNVDRRSAANRIQARFPKAGALSVAVRVIDAEGRSGGQTRTLQVRGPRIEAEPIGTPTQASASGNNNGRIDPGELWQQRLRLRNSGDAAQPAGHALFAASASALPFGPSSDGHTGSSTQAGHCAHGWIDLVSGAHATPALTTAVGNGNTYGPLDDARSSVISLGGNGFALYGERHVEAVMSTNGYVSFDAAESGGDYSPFCDADYSQGARGPQLRPYHFDMVVPGSGSMPANGAGLRYRHFAQCPRPAASGGAQGCHVFSWTRMQSWSGGSPSGDFDFQAIAYEVSGEVAYQYRNTPVTAGAGFPTVGIANRSGDVAFDLTCNTDPVIVAPASSVCLFAPDAQPATRSLALLTQAVQAVPALAPGASVELTLPLSVPADAACGSPLGVDYLGTASTAAQSAVRAAVVDAEVDAQCVVYSGPFIDPPPPVPALARHQGLYFNPQRDGNGVANFAYRLGAVNARPRRELFGGAWYTGLRDRTPVWYTLQGEIVEGAGEVDLRRFTNTAAPFGFAPQGERVGRAWVGQADADTLLLAWTLADGSQGIEQVKSAGLPSGSPNHTQTWFNDGQSGWGLAIESLDVGSPLEFFGAFIYDNGGQPRWLVGDLGSFAGGNVSLTGFRPHCPLCPWIVDWSADGQPAGSINLRYAGVGSALLDAAISLPPAYPGAWTRTDLPIKPITEPAQ